MREELLKWCHILDEWVAMAEQELKGVEKGGTVPTAPNTKNTQPLSPTKARRGLQ